LQWFFSFIFIIFLSLQSFPSYAEESIGVSVELSSAPERVVNPKSLFTSVFNIKNTSSSQDTYDLKVSAPPGWGIVSSLSPVTLLQKESKTVTLTIFVPQTALTGPAYEISLMASSQQNPVIISKASMNVNVLPHARIRVTGPQQGTSPELKGIPGQGISYKFNVLNLGNGADKIQISAISAHGEKVDLSKDMLELGVGSHEEVTATIHIPLDVSPGTKHVLFFKAISSLLEKGVFDETKVYTSILEKKPRKEEGMYKSLPSRATFYISGLGTGKEVSQQVAFNTHGNVTDKNWVDFNYEGPYYKNKENYRGLTNEKISFESGSDYWDMGVGDINASLSELTVSSLSERGAKFHAEKKPLGISAFSFKRKVISFTEDLQGAKVTGDITKDTELGLNFFQSEEDKTDASASRPAEKKEIASLSISQYIKNFSLQGEYARSKLDKGSGNTNDSAWWINPKLRSQRIYADAEYLYAGADYPGRRSDNEMYRGYLSCRILKPVWAWIHRQKFRNNLDKDLTENLDHKDITEIGASFSAKKFPYLSLAYEMDDSKSEKDTVLSDLTEKSVVFRSETELSRRQSLSLNSKWSDKKDPVANINTKASEYTTRLYTRFEKFNTWFGYTYIMENDVILEENTSSKRKEAGLTYQPSAKFYASLSFSQEGSTGQTNSNITTLEFSYYPQDYESFHFEAEQRNDSTFNKEWQVWLAYSRDFDLPLFFIKVKGALKGNVFIDENNNGILDKGEALASNISFILEDSKAAVNKNGVFVFPSIEPGEYDLDIDISSLPVDLVARTPMPYKIKIKRGRAEHVNIPLVKVCRVIGIVFQDLNKDGKLDTDEIGLPLIRVTLEREDFKSRDTFTAQDGKFSFATVPPGTYILRLDKEWLPQRFIMTTPEEYGLELKPSQDALNIIFGAIEKEKPIIKTFTTKPLEPVKPIKPPKPKNPIVEFFKKYILKK